MTIQLQDKTAAELDKIALQSSGTFVFIDRETRDKLQRDAVRRSKVFDESHCTIAVGWRDGENVLTVSCDEDALDIIQAMPENERPDTFCLCWRDDALKMQWCHLVDYGKWSERVRHIEDLTLLDCIVVDGNGAWISIHDLMP